MNSSHSYCPRWIHLYAVVTAVLTVFLLMVGALVTSTGSSLAVPDWPLSFGQYFPEMVGGVLYEHGHRMIAGTVGILTLGLCLVLWLNRGVARAIQWTGTAALFAVVLQALLGGITVLYRLPPAVSVAHACLAQIFFCLIITIVVMTSRWWAEAGRRPLATPDRFGIHAHALLLVVLFFVQLAMGATMRHLGAGLAIPDFPLAFGGLIPPLHDFSVVIHFGHRVGAFVVTGMSLWLATRIYIHHYESSALVGIVGLLVSLIAVQLVLGAVTIWAARPVWITTLHLVVGAGCFGSAVALALACHRVFTPVSRQRAMRLETANVTA